MANPIQAVQSLPNATKSEKRISDFILQNPLAVIRLTLSQLAAEAGSSNTAVIRFCQRLGYKGYTEFKYDMSRYVLSGQQEISRENETTEGRVDYIIDAYVHQLNRMKAEIDIENLRWFAKQICSAKRLACYGYNRTGLSARQLAYRLNKVGIACQALDDMVGVNDYFSILDEDDFLLLFSISGSNLRRMMGDLPDLKTKAGLITMTAYDPFQKRFDKTLLLPRISSANNQVGEVSFLDDQALFFVGIELLLSEVAKQLGE